MSTSVHELTLPATGSFSDVVTDPLDSIVRFVEQALEEGQPETLVIVVLRVPPTDDTSVAALHEAAFEGARGIVGALTWESASEGLRINLVRASVTDDIGPTMSYLSADTGYFVAGATLDLTGVFE
jgi:hypothetical protein